MNCPRKMCQSALQSNMVPQGDCSVEMAYRERVLPETFLVIGQHFVYLFFRILGVGNYHSFDAILAPL